MAVTWLTQSPLPEGSAERPFALQFNAVGQGPVRYQLIAGLLPPRATFSMFGLLAWPDRQPPGIYNFTIRAIDITNQSSTRDFRVIIPNTMTALVRLPLGDEITITSSNPNVATVNMITAPADEGGRVFWTVTGIEHGNTNILINFKDRTEIIPVVVNPVWEGRIDENEPGEDAEGFKSERLLRRGPNTAFKIFKGNKS